MKKMIAIMLAAGAMSGFAAPTANEDFVVAEDARTYTNAVQAAKEYTDAAVATAARPATRIVTEDGTRFTDATGCVFAVSFGVGRFVVTNLFRMAPGVEFAYTNINPIAWALVDGSPAFQQMAKFVAYDATMKRWIALNVSYESLLTPENIAGFDASFQSATNTPIDAASFTLYDRGYVGDADHAEGTFYNVAGAPVTSLVDRVVFESSVPQSAGISTNDVCAIVTNEVPSDGFTEWSFSGFPDGTTNISASFENGVLEVRFNFDGVAFYGVFSVSTDETSVELQCDDYDATVTYIVTATRTRLTRNALGLARLVDLPPLTNGVAVQMSELRSDIAAAAQSATNYTDAAIADVAQSATNYTDSAIADADTTYARFAIPAPTNVNQSVQYVNVAAETPSTLAVLLPQGSGTHDWIIYVNARTNVTISLPAATWWLADTSATNDIAPATPTALYFSQAADGIYTLGRQEFTEVQLP